MNDKNTLENKERFFALYIGQPVLHVSGDGRGKTLDKSWNWKHPSLYLKLKTIDKISDEQLIELMSRFGYNKFTEVHRHSHEIILRDPNRGYETELVRINFERNVVEYDDMVPYEGHSWDLGLEAYDYLRSQSFILPFDGITVDELLSFGWAKIQE